MRFSKYLLLLCSRADSFDSLLWWLCHCRVGKVESRRNSLSLDRLWVFLAYVVSPVFYSHSALSTHLHSLLCCGLQVAVGPMTAFFFGRMASAPHTPVATAKRSGSFQFRPLMYFTLINYILMGLMLYALLFPPPSSISTIKV
jgi:hypothetical protein